MRDSQHFFPCESIFGQHEKYIMYHRSSYIPVALAVYYYVQVYHTSYYTSALVSCISSILQYSIQVLVLLQVLQYNLSYPLAGTMCAMAYCTGMKYEVQQQIHIFYYIYILYWSTSMSSTGGPTTSMTYSTMYMRTIPKRNFKHVFLLMASWPSRSGRRCTT
jgi:hypothetical protein